VKKAVLILALFILTKPFYPLVEYVVKYDYISKELCINKEVPIMACNGKCYLISELAKSSDTDFQKPISDKKVEIKQVEILFFQEIKSLVFKPKFNEYQERNRFEYIDLYNYLNTSSVFHPPTIIS
jgi:hypothetical protein